LNSYEAFVIYTFMHLLFEFLGGEESTLEIVRDKEELRLGWPLHKIKLPPPAEA
jgi:hypothetical protein